MIRAVGFFVILLAVGFALYRASGASLRHFARSSWPFFLIVTLAILAIYLMTVAAASGAFIQVL